ncbi:MAG: hypothetical protein IJR88_04530 [Clostridia bacterium]|nr:hypothetical protein [Clostridia bacterium]
MKRKRTRYFHKSIKIVCAFGAGFLLFLLTAGKEIAKNHFNGMAALTFSLLALSALSLLLFLCVPFFRGDRRWYAIPSVMTFVFFCGASILWRVPVGGI